MSPEDATEEDIAEYERAISYLMNGSKTAKLMIEFLEDSEEVFTIKFNNTRKMEYEVHANTIHFDPRFGAVLNDGYSVLSPAMGLAHEMGHAVQELKHMYIVSMDELEEANLELYERPIARELGEPIRNNYSDAGNIRTMNNSTHFITKGVGNAPWWWRIFWPNEPYYVAVEHNR